MCPDDELPAKRGGTDAYDSTQPGDIRTALESEGAPLQRPATALDLPPSGYDVGDVIGRGGMGEVIAAHDKRIGRAVALKRMRAVRPTDNAVGRFLREARIQARLDHPAIVPVHELGVDADGRPYFTMKRLAGVTLAERLRAADDEGPRTAADERRMLRAFVDVCLAIEFAHARGIVHRDLKPQNIMLGDYGEVYVLDWGVAHVVSEPDRAASEADDIDPIDQGTEPGDLLGTPGYMAPEQVRAQPVVPATDVYALGAILFEILAGETLHPRGLAALSATLSSPQQSPVIRRPERNIAPELDAACVAALAEAPASRPSARDLGERIQAYLDGDRDIAHRRTLALQHIDAARAAFDSGDPEARTRALRSAGRALALDPESPLAASLVTAMILAPPKELPAELVARLAQEERQVATGRIRGAVLSLLAPFAFLLLLPWLQVRSWSQLIGFYVIIGVTAAVNWQLYRRGRPSVPLNLLSSLVVSVAFSRVLGPLVLTPITIIGVFLAIGANTWLNRRPWVILAWLVVVTLTPFALEGLGLLGSTWSLTPGGLLSTSQIYAVGGPLDWILLVGADIALLAAVVIYAIGVSRKVDDARRDLTIQAWHLGQLVPLR